MCDDAVYKSHQTYWTVRNDHEQATTLLSSHSLGDAARAPYILFSRQQNNDERKFFLIN